MLGMAAVTVPPEEQVYNVRPGLPSGLRVMSPGLALLARAAANQQPVFSTFGASEIDEQYGAL